MPSRIFTLPVALVLILLAGHVHADGRWRDLPPEERRELREQMREQWQSRREQESSRAPRGDGRGEALPPEERQRLRDEMREQQRQTPERGGRRHRY
ncbi:hypothetical protein [Azonexus sp.]|uniref:hypothetical protein n=1 Tax=Azonexus sp. TaxID=1872668 RepID=UPI0039E363D0